jgi:hypothetical protein
MPNTKTAVLWAAVLFYTVNATDVAVDYDASHLWIMGFALWITLAGLAVDIPALRARAHLVYFVVSSSHAVLFLCVLWFLSTCSPFSVWSVFSVDSSTLAVLRVALF